MPPEALALKLAVFNCLMICRNSFIIYSELLEEEAAVTYCALIPGKAGDPSLFLSEIVVCTEQRLKERSNSCVGLVQ